MEYRLSEYSPTERKVDDREGQCNVWYNDDSAILSRHRNLDTLVESTPTNMLSSARSRRPGSPCGGLRLNSSKTEAVFFSKRKPPPEVTLQNQRTPWS
ncbi:hypothetical protein TNCV_2585131 [Trichonephila clavipes]|nr:hypothetical protein TNCV_2585131 [Trichonephila clavipes]